MGRIYGALPAYHYIKNGSNDLIILIDVDKTEHDIYNVTFSPNLPDPANFVPFGTMRNSLFDINLISITYIKFVYLYFSLFLNKDQTFLFAMIYDLPIDT